MKSFVVIGLGLFGTKLAKELYNAGGNVLVIDQNEKLVEQIADNVSRAVCLDAKDRSALLQVGVNKYDCVIVSISGDLATSVLITMNLKALNVPNIVCKVRGSADREVLETLGASSCITPEHIGATNLAKKMTSKNIVDFIQLSDDLSIIEIPVPDSWIGNSILDLNIRSKYHVNIIGIKNDGKSIYEINPANILHEEDTLIIIGKNDILDKLQNIK